MNKIPFNFPIEVFDLEKVDDVKSKARLRVFYKGGNRNGGYISDEFAEELIKTLPYTPVKGIYEEEEEDFTDHGEKRSLGKIYGIVPETMNFAWTEHLDEDGVTRTYATTDVLLFTALYEEANDILGKKHSMELYAPSITGNWVEINDQLVYKYTGGCFLGLQVLGDNVTPCFEGSAFFSLDNKESQQFYVILASIFEKLNQLTIGEVSNMNKTYNPIFALSDSQKQDKIFQALNPETIRYWVFDTYDEYAIAYDMEDDKFYKVAYTKNDTENTVTVSEDKTEIFREFVTSEEMEALNKLRETTEKVTFAEILDAINEYNKTITEMQTDIDNKVEEISTLNQSVIEKDNQIGQLQGQVTTYSEYKENREKEEKEQILVKYSKRLGKDIIETYTAKLAEFTVSDLDKELAYELVKNDATLFESEEGGLIPKPGRQGGLEALLSKHKK